MYNETVHELFVDFKKAYDSVRREVLYNILIEFGVHMKRVSLIKILWRVSRMRELLKREASKQKKNECLEAVPRWRA
jgi:hypothetical protein